jgi:3-deoxy-D-manno-octulosonate 8-phosphate phosphatase (KDO 8-P phosphatase)
MINYDLKKIKAFVFDVDGVLSSTRVFIIQDGELMRSSNVKDGYALQLAVKKGFEVGVITGGVSMEVFKRYQKLCLQHIYIGSYCKLNDYKAFLKKTGLTNEQVMYCGDDIPDIEVMQVVGLPVAPADAAPEIKRIAKYISPNNGGDGVARDIIEQTLKIQGLWMDEDAFTW